MLKNLLFVALVFVQIVCDAKFVNLKPFKLGKISTRIEVFSNDKLISENTAIRCIDKALIDDVIKANDTSHCKSKIIKDTSTEAIAETICTTGGVENKSRIKFSRISEIKQIAEVSSENGRFRIITAQSYLGKCD